MASQNTVYPVKGGDIEAAEVATSGKLGVNGKTPQAAVTANAAVAATGTTQSTPFGFTTAAQGDNLVALVNQMRATLVAMGIMA